MRSAAARTAVLFVIIYAGFVAGGMSNTYLHDFLIVSLDGKNTTQFLQIRTDFQDLIVALAITFCNTNGLLNCANISSSSVEINSVRACPSEWPSAELCVNVNFSVVLTDSNASSYGLSHSHLYSLWRTHNTSQLSLLSLQEYELPSNTTILILWLCVTGALFVFFLLILVVVVRTKFIENFIRRRRDMLGSSNRSWLNQQNTKQLVPPFFYPEPPPENHVLPHQLQYDVSSKHNMFGIENPAYDPESKITSLGNEISTSSVIIDDFDSDDETIYPPSPLPRPNQQRNDRGKDAAVSQEELETAF